MFTVLAITATGAVSSVASLTSPTGRRWINRMVDAGQLWLKAVSYDGRHHLKPSKAERAWVGGHEPRRVYMNLKTQWN